MKKPLKVSDLLGSGVSNRIMPFYECSLGGMLSEFRAKAGRCGGIEGFDFQYFFFKKNANMKL